MKASELATRLTRLVAEFGDFPVDMLIDGFGRQTEAPVRDIAAATGRFVLMFEEEVHGSLNARNITETKKRVAGLFHDCSGEFCDFCLRMKQTQDADKQEK